MKKRAILILVMVLTVLCMIPSTAVYADKPLCSGTLDCDNYTLEQVKTFYYDQLTKDEKTLYKAITKATIETPSFQIAIGKNYDKTEIYMMTRRSMGAVVSEMPEYRMIWERHIDSANYEYDKNTGILSVKLRASVVYSPYNYEKAMSNCKDMALAVEKEEDTLTRFCQLVKLYADNVSYNSADMDVWGLKNGALDDSAMGVFLTNSAVCAGLADGFKMLCNELDIPCIVVGNGGHAWNMVLIEGKWYECDPTAFVDCPDILYNHALQGSVRFNSGNGALTEMYISEMGDFEFPIVSEKDYNSEDLITADYGPLNYSFKEPAARYVYKVNEDGKTCTVVGYEGPQSGDLNIPKVIEGYTVTVIGEAAFIRSKFDGKLVLPDTIEKISEDAFASCENLTGELRLPSKLKEIEGAAFYKCKNLTGSLILPNAMTNIGRVAFCGCSGLTGNLYIPATLNTWGETVILESRISSISVDKNNKHFAAVDGALYNKKKTVLIVCPPGKEGELKMPNTLKEIKDFACYGCEKVTGTLNLPYGVSKIGYRSFRFAGFTGDLIIPNSVKSIGDSAFSFGQYTGNLILSNSLEYLGDWAFYASLFTGTLVIPNSIQEYDASCTSAFSECQFDQIVFRCSNRNFKSILSGLSNVWCDIVEVHNEEAVVTKKSTCQEEGETTYTCKDCGNQRTEPIEKHSYASGIITKSPTCTEAGVKIYTCTACGYQKTEQTELHNYDGGSVTKQPTCRDEGVKTYTCRNCNATKTERVGVLSTHTEEDIPMIEATCTTPGNIGGKYCTTCGKIIVEPKELPVLPEKHSFSNGNTCEVCGWVDETQIPEGPTQPEEPDSLEPPNIPEEPTQSERPITPTACSHKWKSATCKKAKTCLLCGKTQGKALGHKAGVAKLTVKATATKSGKKVSRCKNCNAVMKTVKIKALRTSVLGKTYNGKKIKKSDIRVKTADGKLIPAKYYTITNFKSQKNIGKYTYTIKFKNTCPEYKGTAKVKFEIKPPKPSLKKLTAGKRSITAYWTKRPASQVSGYEVMVSRNKNFNGGTHSYDGNNKTAGFYVCDSLKSKKTYYVKVRCYKYVNGVKLYSDWSAAKTMKTK